jgi:hypothetical protein
MHDGIQVFLRTEQLVTLTKKRSIRRLKQILINLISLISLTLADGEVIQSN